jgi:hypothetical protein
MFTYLKNTNKTQIKQKVKNWPALCYLQSGNQNSMRPLRGHVLLRIKMNINIIKSGIIGLALGLSNISNAGIITFDDPIALSEPTYSADGDGDSIIDVVFSTSDVGNFGFYSGGPGSNQLYTDGIGLGFSYPDQFKIDFIHGAVNNLNFGMIFGNFIGVGGIDELTFSVFDSSNNELASVTQIADYTLLNGGNQSSYPETLVNISFSQVASYATITSLNGPSSDFFIDNFSGTFGSSERASVPEPSTLAILTLSLIGLTARRFKK